MKNYSCPNCHSDLPEQADYCYKCGQKRIHPEDHSVWHLIIESLGDFFHFDSKFFRTLTPLIFRPGFLTTEYLKGRRARYFQPFKLFLFISFLYFVTSGLISHRKHNEDQGVRIINKNDTAALRSTASAYKLSLADDYDRVLALTDDSLRKFVKIYGLNRFVNLKYPRESWLVRFIIKQVVKDRIQGSVTFADNMHRTLPKLVFILIPFMAILLKLLYIRRNIPYFNHIIFSLHFLSFVFLIFWFNIFLSKLAGWAYTAISIMILVYLFSSMVYSYRQKILITSGKFLLLFFGIMTMLGIFFILAASISFMLI